jgi:hypothetical protein
LKADGTPDGKYRARYGDNRHVYFPPGSGPRLADTSVPSLVVEVEKSASAIKAAADRAGRRVLVVRAAGAGGGLGASARQEMRRAPALM